MLNYKYELSLLSIAVNYSLIILTIVTCHQYTTLLLFQLIIETIILPS